MATHHLIGTKQRNSVYSYIGDSILSRHGLPWARITQNGTGGTTIERAVPPTTTTGHSMGLTLSTTTLFKRGSLTNSTRKNG